MINFGDFLAIINCALLVVLLYRNFQSSKLADFKLDEIHREQFEILNTKLDEKLNKFSQNYIVTTDQINRNLSELKEHGHEQMRNLTDRVADKLDKLQNNNEQKLEQMRLTVDEKLNTTLNQRLAEKFKTVSEHLAQVNQGIGQVQLLSKGVDDLKTVLSSVKLRGTWGEMQLEVLLSDILAPHQFAKQYSVDKSLEKVDFVIKIPNLENNSEILFPIDSKFPIEDYQRLVLLSQDSGNLENINKLKEKLYTSVKEQAKRIKKYIKPPITTEFAIMYLPLEGLFAEISSNVELNNTIRNNYQIIIAGPSTTAALLSSLQLGFKSITITKKAHEVWQMLGTVKNDFAKLEDLIARAAKNIQEAGNRLEDASKRGSIIDKKLNKFENIDTNLLE